MNDKKGACLFATVLYLFATSAPAPAQTRPLAHVIAYFQTDGRSFEEALEELARSGTSAFVIGFEVAEPNAERPPIRASMDDSTVAQILTFLCTQDKRYGYADAGQGVIDVIPTRESATLHKILEMSVSEVDLHVYEWPQNVISRLSDFLPDLRSFLEQHAAEWARNTGHPLPGSPGLTMSTNVKPPLLAISLRNTTVRGVLNAIAAYTIRRQVDSSPVIGPSGWKAEFVPDDQAPTTLGGYLKFSVFP
jgi:hypothetical protein